MAGIKRVQWTVAQCAQAKMNMDIETLGKIGRLYPLGLSLISEVVGSCNDSDNLYILLAAMSSTYMCNVEEKLEEIYTRLNSDEEPEPEPIPELTESDIRDLRKMYMEQSASELYRLCTGAPRHLNVKPNMKRVTYVNALIEYDRAHPNDVEIEL